MNMIFYPNKKWNHLSLFEWTNLGVTITLLILPQVSSVIFKL